MAIDSNRWGILYCPRNMMSGSRKYRLKLERLLEDRHVAYDLVQSESADSVSRLMLMLVNNGYKTIVIVGGDSALNDAINSLMTVDKACRDEIAVGLIPHGMVNDFAKFWGCREKEMARTVDALVSHRVRRIDVGCLRYTDKKGTACRRYFVNCVNIGLIADIMDLRRQTRKLFGSRTLSFLVSALLLIFHRMEYKIDMRINDEKLQRKVMNVCVGSGPGYGQTPNAVPYNGLLDVTVVSHPEIWQLFEGFWLLFSGRFLNHRSVRPYRTHLVKVVSAPHAMIGVDGRLLGIPRGEYEITIELEEINFLIPA